MTQDTKGQAIEPEGVLKVGFGHAEHETDAEGHLVKRNAATEEPGIDPEGVAKRNLETEDGDTTGGAMEPGPDDLGHGWSDRNLKVAIVPIQW